MTRGAAEAAPAGFGFRPQAVRAISPPRAPGAVLCHAPDGEGPAPGATRLPASLGPRFGGSEDHGVKTAGFFVLLGAQMPSVLYETAFISNPDDESRLGTADFRQKLADSVVNAVRAYREGHR